MKMKLHIIMILGGAFVYHGGYTASATDATKASPHASAIAIIVNNDIITYKDIQKRVNLILLSTGQPIEPTSPTTELWKQVEDALIQERLQYQVASRLGATVTEEELNHVLTNIAAENKMTRDEMKQMFQEKGVAFDTLITRVKINVLWIKAIRGAFSNYIKISDTDVAAEKAKILADESKDQLHLQEIVIYENVEKNALAKIRSLHESLKTGTAFQTAARNFSQAPSGARGGDIGWIATDRLAKGVQNLKIGEFSDPILQGNRYVIYYCADRKLANQGPTSQEKITFFTAQFSLSPEQVENIPETLTSFIEESQNLQGCPVFKDSAETHGVTANEHNDVAFFHLPDDFRKLLTELPVGKVSHPLRVSETDILFVMVCGKKNPPKSTIPSDSEISMMIADRKIQERAAAEFNKIKSVATIEYRLAR